MKGSKEKPQWMCKAIDAIAARHDGGKLFSIAEKIASEEALAPLWKTMEKKFDGDSFWGSAGAIFQHFVLSVSVHLKEPAGYRAMSPARLDEWRKKTQGHAISLLGDLMEGYPEIAQKEDDTFLSDKWIWAAAVQIATNGELDSIGDIVTLALERNESVASDKFTAAFAVAARLPLIINRLIRWLDYEAAEGHSITHALSGNAHRNSFIRRMTEFFELHFDSPMRAHVYNLAALFFDMGGLDVAGIKKIAPARGGGKIPAAILGKLPG